MKNFTLPDPKDLTAAFKLPERHKEHGQDAVHSALGLAVSMAMCTNGLEDNINVVKTVFSILENDTNLLYSFIVGFMVAEVIAQDETERINDLLDEVVSTIRDNFEQALIEMNLDAPDVSDAKVMADRGATAIFEEFLKKRGNNAEGPDEPVVG